MHQKQYINFDELTSQVSNQDFIKSNNPKFLDSPVNRTKLLIFFSLLTAFIFCGILKNTKNSNEETLKNLSFSVQQYNYGQTQNTDNGFHKANSNSEYQKLTNEEIQTALKFFNK